MEDEIKEYEEQLAAIREAIALEPSEELRTVEIELLELISELKAKVNQEKVSTKKTNEKIEKQKTEEQTGKHKTDEQKRPLTNENTRAKRKDKDATNEAKIGKCSNPDASEKGVTNPAKSPSNIPRTKSGNNSKKVDVVDKQDGEIQKEPKQKPVDAFEISKSKWKQFSKGRVTKLSRTNRR